MAGRLAEGHAPRVPLNAALDPAARRVVPRRRPSAATGLSALAAAFLLLVFSSAGTLATTTASPRCDGVNLRTGASTSYTKMTSVNTGAVLTVSATVTGGSYLTSCAGVSLSGSGWYRFSAINGKSISSLYGVSYLYGASKLFNTVTSPTPSPTKAPTPAPTVLATPAAPTAAPTDPSISAPTAAPTLAPSLAPTATPTTTMSALCDSVNLRTGASTSYAIKVAVSAGTKVTVVSTVSGGSWSTSCNGSSLSGSSWRRITAINGVSVSSTYGVSYLYGASGLFTTVASPTPAPTPAAPTAAPTTAPTPDPSATPDASASPVPSTAPSPTPAPTATPNPVTLPATITFYGRGYGHGVGLSQYGAKGRALDGQSAETILAHYYKGTTIGAMSNSQVRVLVLQSFAATSTNPVQVYGRGATWTIDGVSKTFPADARLRFTPTVSGTTTTWKVLVTATDGSTLYSAASPSNIRIRSGSGTTLQLWSTPSAYDRFRGVLRLIGNTNGTSLVNVVNELPMEYYLRGVVPAEISASWPVESIKAQAIAARSYAEYRLHPTTGTYDVYNDTRSQVYLGYLDEKSATTAAVTATAGKVLRSSSGAKVTALFHSSDGGWTENNENVFTSSTGAKTAGVYSYLRGSSDRRPDGTSYDSTSPYATWHTNTYTLAQIQAWFAADSRSNVGTLVALDLRNRGVSGRLISVTLIGANGTTKQVSGAVFESIFNAHRPSGDPSMRSTLFDLIPIP
jgi:SpoIID/LytB domain protein